MPDLGIFKLKFKKTIVVLEISTLEFVKMHKSVLNKNLRFGTNPFRHLGPFRTNPYI